MNITLTLNAEQTDALTERVALYNSSSGKAALTNAEFLEQEQLIPYIKQLADERYARSLIRLGEKFKTKDYEVRLATIATLEAQA